MIFITVILACIVGNLCSRQMNLFSVDNITLFFILSAILYVSSRIYFLFQARINLETIATSAKHLKLISLIASFITSVFGFIYFVQYSTTSWIDILSSVGLLLSGLCFISITALLNRGRIQNQLIANLGTMPIIWMVYEIILIFKNNLSNPNISEYILIIALYASTSMMLYYFTSAFCVVDKTNLFKEYFNLSVFMTIVYMVAHFSGYVTSSSINTTSVISSCAMFNLFVAPYYITAKKSAVKQGNTEFNAPTKKPPVNNIPQKPTDKDIPPKANNTNIPPKSNNTNIPPKTNNTNIPQKTNNTNIPPKTNNTNIPPKSNNTNIPPKSNNTNIPPKSNNTNIPPKTDKKDVPPTKK